jgi:hypothetical protein
MLSCLAFCSFPESPNAAPRASIARELLDEARMYAGIGDWKSAESCLDEAAIDDSGDADILYLGALAIVKRSGKVDDALAKLDAALETRRFAYYGIWDARLLKAELLVRERRTHEALEVLGNPAPIALADPAYALIHARALALSGDGRAFQTAIADALRRFPDNSGVARLFLLRSGRLPESDAARSNLRIVLGRLSLYAANDPELPVLAAPYMTSLSDRKDAVIAYRATGGSSATATLRALEYGLIDEKKAAAELLSGGYAFTLGDLESLYSLAGSPAGRDAVHAALSEWSGSIAIDEDSDGVSEGLLSLDRGQATSYERDSRQCGVVDESVSFSESAPASLRLLRPSQEIFVSYLRYPAVASIAFSSDGDTRLYSFSPEAMAYAPLEMRLFSGSGKDSILLPYRESAAAPSERDCLMRALSVESDSGDEREVTVVDKGRPLSSVRYKGSRVYSTTSYERGAPSLERIDADGDGRFETEKGFSSSQEGGSRPEWLRTDEDGDGIFEYYEELQAPFMKEWDFDGDGSYDVRSIVLADGAVKTEYSSRLDGRFDEAIVVKDGAVLSVSRDGSELPLVRDANPKLLWLGRKAFDIGSNLPPDDGVYTQGGKRYRLTRVGALAFAELIP